MEKITEIFIVLENRPSTLGELCSYLAENKVNIEAIGVFQDVAKLYVKNTNKAIKVLSKADYTIDLRDVLKVELENRPGTLAEVATKCGEEGININYVYGTVSSPDEKCLFVLCPEDIDLASKIFSE